MNIENCKGCAFAQKFFNKLVESHITKLEDYCMFYNLSKNNEEMCPCSSCIVKPVCMIFMCPKTKEFVERYFK